METLNAAFFFVTDKIISLQAFFIGQALAIGQLVLLISILAAALNYALTGQGLKENIIKITKALVFFFIVIFAYPQIISFITHWTFDRAHASTFGRIESSVLDQRTMMADSVVDAQGQGHWTFSQEMMYQLDRDGHNSMDFFGGDLLRTRRFANITYTVVAPAAAMGAVLQVAAECFRWAGDHRGADIPYRLGRTILGSFLALIVIFIGVFAILEYLMAYLEFLLVSSVGVILFPLSIWEGSRFLSEKFIGAIIGFFIKLLFCNITLFLMLWGFTSLANSYTTHPFTGTAPEIVVVIFICLMFFYICKSAPGIAQGLLSGVPSLSATGAMQQTVPVLVNVMPTGEAVYIGEVRQGAGIQVPEAAIHFQLRRFVTNLRSISTDPMVLYNNINECFAMVTNTFAPIMTNTLRSASPFELVGRVRRQVEISSIIRTTGASYQIDWYELSIYGAGTQRTARFRAIATIVLLPPDPSTIRLNPLGIFIENFQMTEL